MNSKFVGRLEELRKFKAILEDYPQGGIHVAFLYDATQFSSKGGIGKTKLLYQFKEIANSFNDKFLVINEIFDYFEPVNRDRLSRISRLAQYLEKETGSKVFDEFWRKCREYYNRNVAIERVLQEYFDAYTLFCQETGKSVICFFDTFELAETNLNYLQKPYRFFDSETLNNSLLVIAGRHGPDLKAPIWEGRKNHIVEFPLGGFNDWEADQYFKSTGHQYLTVEETKYLNRRVNGRPILLALISDYLNTILKVDDILKLEEEDFEKQLVGFLREFKKPPIEEAILALAHLKHWCNTKFLAHFIKPQDDFEKSFEVLKTLSFVRQLGSKKDYIVLHDEMQKLVLKYVLEEDDEDGSLRREMSRQAILFFDEEISNLRIAEKLFENNGELSKRQIARDERFILEAERWYQKLYVNHVSDIDYYFYELYDPNLEEGHLDYCFVLQSHLNDLDELLQLPDRIKNRIELRAARLYTEKYQNTSNKYYFEEAKHIFQKLIDNAQKRDEKIYLGVLYCDYGTLEFYYRDLIQAEKILRDSIRLLTEEIERNNHSLHYFMGKSKNWLGYILYSQGKFKVSIDTLQNAEDHLIKAANLIEKDPQIVESLKDLRRKQIEAWLAQVRGNLCRIYREVGDAEKAAYYGESSLFRRIKLGNIKEVIKGLNSLGLVYSRAGETSKALGLFEDAEKKLQNVPDPILKGRILTNKATLLFKRDQYSDLLSKCTKTALYNVRKVLAVKDKDIDQARELLNDVVTALYRSNSREFATANHNLGELHLMEEKFNIAVANFAEAVRVAKIENDKYTLLNSLQRLVLASYLKNDPTLFKKFARDFDQARQELETFEETARYIIRYHITVGNYYYDNFFDSGYDGSNFLPAFHAYTNAILYAREHAEHSVKLTYEVFSNRIIELFKSTVVSGDLSSELFEFWRSQNLDTKLLQRYLDF